MMNHLQTCIQEVLDASNDPMCIVDLMGNITMVNQAWKQFADGNKWKLPHDGIGTKYFDIGLHAETKKKPRWGKEVSNMLKMAIDKGKPSTKVFPLFCSFPTTQRWFEITVKPISGPQNSGVHGLVRHHDIFQNKEIALMNKRHLQQVKTIMKSLPLFLIAVDKKGNMIEWNQECIHKTGFSAQEASAQSSDTVRCFITSNSGKLPVNPKLDQAIKHHSIRGMLPCKDGKSLTISWVEFSEPFPVDGWHRYWLGIDLTDAVEQKKKLELITGIIQSRNMTKTNNGHNILPMNNEHKNVQQSMLNLLTSKERDILALICQGKTNKEIAGSIQLSDQTVRNYISKVFQKLNVSRRSEAVACFVKILAAVDDKMYSEKE